MLMLKQLHRLLVLSKRFKLLDTVNQTLHGLFFLFSPILKSRRQPPASYFTSSTHGTTHIVRDKTFVLGYRGPNPGFVV